jgi:hypothetical protein
MENALMPPFTSETEQVGAWLAGALPDGWFTASPTLTVDREEILVEGGLPDVDLPKGTTDDARRTAREARIDRWREETRGERMRIADEIERRWDRKVAWAAAIGDVRIAFTSLSVPVMTRLRQADRLVLDTLVEAGVARSRSEALAWCVRLVGKNEAAWIAQLRDAMESVARVRGEGPAGR